MDFYIHNRNIKLLTMNYIRDKRLLANRRRTISVALSAAI